MESDTLFYDSFGPVSTSSWIERIEAELGLGRTFESLFWETEPGLTVKPFYRKEDVDFLSGPLPGEHRSWLICDRMQESLQSTVVDRIAASVKNGADMVDVSQEAWQDDSDFLAFAALEGADVMVRGTLRLYERILEQESDHLLPEGVRLLVDPLIPEVGPSTAGHPFDTVSRIIRRESEAKEGIHAGAIDGEWYRKRGATVSATIAHVLAALSEWCLSLSERSILPDRFVSRLTVVIPIGEYLYPEIAGMRALRLLLPQVVAPYIRGGATALLPQLHAVSLCPEPRTTDASIHLVRSTLQTIAGILGGADSIALSRSGASEKDPDAEVTSLRNIQLMLKHEAMLDRVTGALAGSFYIEHLTDLMAQKAWERFLSIENRGGLLRLLNDGSIERELARERSEWRPSNRRERP